MIHSARFIAVLDACVLYPAPMRDLLLNLANAGLYTPKWTDEINREWTRNLLINRPNISAEQLQRTVDAMEHAFPDASVSHYESLINSIQLPDKDDGHVVAAAIRCKADVIVTANTKDFPSHYLQEFDIEIQHPDFFIFNLIELNPESAWLAFKKQVAHLRNPPRTITEVLDNFQKIGLKTTSKKLQGLNSAK